MIAGFIPLAIYVFTAHSLNVPQETQLAYSQLSNQINTGFILNVRKNCTPEEAVSCNSTLNKLTFTVFNTVSLTLHVQSSIQQRFVKLGISNSPFLAKSTAPQVL